MKEKKEKHKEKNIEKRSITPKHSSPKRLKPLIYLQVESSRK